MTNEGRTPEECFILGMVGRRQELGWSQERLAEEASRIHPISASAITKAEWIADPERRVRARPLRFNEVEAIAKALGTSTNGLVARGSGGPLTKRAHAVRTRFEMAVDALTAMFREHLRFVEEAAYQDDVPDWNIGTAGQYDSWSDPIHLATSAASRAYAIAAIEYRLELKVDGSSIDEVNETVIATAHEVFHTQKAERARIETQHPGLEPASWDAFNLLAEDASTSKPE